MTYSNQKQSIASGLFASLLLLMLTLAGCAGDKDANHDHDHGDHNAAEHEGQKEEAHALSEARVEFTPKQLKALSVTLDSLPQRPMAGFIKANGELRVPPQHEASVTAIIGGNVHDIQVIPGDRVQRGQVLGYIQHPAIIEMQRSYSDAWHRLVYLNQERERQQRLVSEQVGAGKQLQQVRAEYNQLHASMMADAAKLQLLGIDTAALQKSKFVNKVGIYAPIHGVVRSVNVKTGQFVSPELSLFELVNNDHLHADLVVLEQDMQYVKPGQKITFTANALPEKSFEGEVFTVGKVFESEPRSVHLHARILNSSPQFIPGMYIEARIQTDAKTVAALPEDAIVNEGGKSYAFMALPKANDEDHLTIRPIEISTRGTSEGWVQVQLREKAPKGARFAMSGAYYLLGEIQKGEVEHAH